MKKSTILMAALLSAGTMLASCSSAPESPTSAWADAETVRMDEHLHSVSLYKQDLKKGESAYFKLDASTLDGGHVYCMEELKNAAYDITCYDKDMNSLMISFYTFKPFDRDRKNVRKLSSNGKWFVGNWDYNSYEQSIKQYGEGYFFTFDELEDNIVYVEVTAKRDCSPNISSTLFPYAHKLGAHDYCVNRDYYCGSTLTDYVDAELRSDRTYMTRFRVSGSNPNYRLRIFNMGNDTGRNTLFYDDGSFNCKIELTDNDFNPIEFAVDTVAKSRTVETNLAFTVPSEYLGDNYKYIHLTLTLNDDVTIGVSDAKYIYTDDHSDRIRLEVNR